MRGIVASICFAVLAAAQQGRAETPPAAEPAKPRQLTIANKAWTGDFDRMLERRVIRIYAPFSRSLYFSDKGRERGIAVELARDWERYLNVKYAQTLGKRPLTVYIGPATRDKLLPYVTEGLADVAIGNLTVTEERLKEVDFVPGDEGRRTINEVVVVGPKSPELKAIDDLAGKRFHVRKASSYYESLREPMKLMTNYFGDASFSEGNRPLFAFASYNCGPGNVVKSRREALKRGLDPNKWFNNVEIVVAEKIGTETTTYVRNIYKYYVAYRLTLDAQAEGATARRQMLPAAK